MCIPLLPLALVAAGTAAKFFGERQAQRAREGAFNAERARQKELTDRQIASFQDSVDQTSAMLDPVNRAKAEDARNSALASTILGRGSDAAYLPGSSSAPTLVATAADKAAGSSEANSRSLAQALAALGATGDQMQGLNIGINRNGQQIGQLGGFKAGSMGVLDSEMQAANAKGGFLRGIGGLAQQIGMAAAMGGGGSIGKLAGNVGNNSGLVFSGMRGPI